MAMDGESGIDLQQVRREIEAEVRARRARGEYPPGFERDMDALFDRFAPPEVTEDFETALTRAEENVAVDPVIPTASRNPAFGAVKKIIAKLIGWYHVWLAQRLTGFGAMLTNALRLLGRRVDELEDVTRHAARARATGHTVLPRRDDAVWTPAVIDALRSCEGRIAVIECGNGTLIDTLLAAGIDAYGVEPRADIAEDAIERGLEVRIDDGREHLAHVAEHSLDAVVLRGIVEGTPVGELLGILDLAAAGVRDGGRLVVCSLTVDAWGDGATAVEADLSAGRPLHPETWEVLLPQQGFDKVSTQLVAGGAYVVVALRQRQ
jgi:hypothetical protein